MKSNTIVSQVHPLENCASGLRYGLINVEPFEETKIVKKFGIKFRERRWGLKPSESFHDFLRFNTEAVIESIALPSHLDRIALAKMIAEKRIDAFEKDVEFKKVLEKVEATKTRQGIGLRKLVEFFVDREKTRVDNTFTWYAKFFLASDLPLSFITDFTDFETTYMASLELILSIVRRSAMRMELPETKSNFQKYQRAFNQMKFTLSPIIDQMENAVFRAQALEWYILLSNAKTTETAFEFETIEKSRMDSNELERLHWEFRQDSMRLRKLIMQGADYNRIFHPLVEASDIKSCFDEIAMALTS